MAIFYIVLLLVLAVSTGITVKKIKKDLYRPYYLKHVIVFYSVMGVVFLLSSAILLISI
jgi:hypothetical protein